MQEDPAGDLWVVLLDIQNHTGEVTEAAGEQPDKEINRLVEYGSPAN